MAETGYPHRRPKCKCGTPPVRSERWDAVYCPSCLIWLEKKCTDPSCEFCKDRPDNPPS